MYKQYLFSQVGPFAKLRKHSRNNKKSAKDKHTWLTELNDSVVVFFT